MNKIIKYISLCFFTALVLTSCQEQIDEDIVLQSETQVSVSTNDIIPGVLRVKFRSDDIVEQLKQYQETQVSKNKTGVSSLDLLAQHYSVKKIEPLFITTPRVEKLHRKHGLHLWYEITLDTLAITPCAVFDYDTTELFEHVDPAYKVVSMDNGKIIPLTEKTTKEVRRDYPFNDTYLPKQWHYDRGELQTPKEEANIGLFSAWEITGGSNKVIVSVVDGGIDVTHPDLIDNLWVNESEKNGQPGVDDDGNGFVDDIYGFNFCDNTGNITAHGHGTHVAGTVSAVNNNGIGVCGVAGGTGKGDGARLMSCQIFTINGQPGNSAKAIVYGADMGAVISQNSWGYNQPGITEPSVEAAIKYFVEEAGNPELFPDSPMRGGIVIVAAGNDGAMDRTYYPAAYPECIAVTATNHLNERAATTYSQQYRREYYANIGRWVDIAAPGGMNEQNYGVLSTVPASLSGGYAYGYKNGTSMATPHVSGIAALVVGKMGGTDFTADNLRKILLESVKDISLDEPDYWKMMGSGIARADLALNPNDGIGPVAVSEINIKKIADNNCQLEWVVPVDERDGMAESYQIYTSNKPFTANDISSMNPIEVDMKDKIAGEMVSYQLNNLSEGFNYIAIESLDRWGNVSPLSSVEKWYMLTGNNMRVFPTVVSNKVSVVLPIEGEEKVMISIANSEGVVLFTLSDTTKQIVECDLSNLPSGVYHLLAEWGDSKEQVRIIKH